MDNKIYLKNGFIVNEGSIIKGNILIEGDFIAEIFDSSYDIPEIADIKTIDINGKYVFPGIIDSHVHFREPGMTHKGNISSESIAAVAGGVTSVMEMPNTNPQTTSIENLHEKIKIAENNSLVNYSFYLGATNNNIEELINADSSYVCGIKVFMGASTGNMLVDDENTLEKIFSGVKGIVAVHCEDENIIQANLKNIKEKYGEDIPFDFHPVIRSSEACYKSSIKALGYALKYNTKLHLLHISSEKELDLFHNSPLDSEKQITGEACIHHLLFNDKNYKEKQSLIKWNPAIKSKQDQNSLLESLLNGKIDIVSTDHAPHTIEEKQKPYLQSPSGGPMIQHSLVSMLELYHNKRIKLDNIAKKMCHNPAIRFKIKNRGFIRKNNYADIVVVDINDKWTVNKENILYKCKWSPLEGHKFKSKVIHTFINGNHVYNNGIINNDIKGNLLSFSK